MSRRPRWIAPLAAVSASVPDRGSGRTIFARMNSAELNALVDFLLAAGATS